MGPCVAAINQLMVWGYVCGVPVERLARWYKAGIRFTRFVDCLIIEYPVHNEMGSVSLVFLTV